MAEINIERKKKPVWPWIAGIIAVAVIAWIIIDTSSDRSATDTAYTDTTYNERQATEDPGRPATDDISGDVNDYTSYIREYSGTNGKDDIGEFTSDAFDRLSVAVSAVADKYGENDASIQSVKETVSNNIDRIEDDANSAKNSVSVRAAAISVADLLQRIQRNNFGDMETQSADVRRAAESISSTAPLANQQDKVRNFFEKASIALQSMSGSGSPGNNNMNNSY